MFGDLLPCDILDGTLEKQSEVQLSQGSFCRNTLSRLQVAMCLKESVIYAGELIRLAGFLSILREAQDTHRKKYGILIWI